MSRSLQKRSPSSTAALRGQHGFSLLEMLFATTVLLIGIVGVAQLVPASILLNQSNRTNSSALVVVQHTLDELANQPLSLPLPPAFTDPQGNTFDLGDPTQPSGQLVGSPVALVNNRTAIDFSQNTVPGYNLTYADTSDPTGATWDLRWAVITTTVSANGT